MLEYKQEIPTMTDLLALYSSVGWTNYTNNPTMLEEAVKASIWQLAVYDEKALVAYIRLVGDGHSVLLVQDLLVRPDHQRQGIGRKLLEEALATFPNVYQRLLATDRSEVRIRFRRPTSAQLSRAVKADKISVVEPTQPLRLARQSKNN
ncbi:MAG: GNAT family N-acetyltransferase [Streptococcus parasanguinis]|nr:GNAT family N-acetyltransferase [Streptococcus parasanguinis]